MTPDRGSHPASTSSAASSPGDYEAVIGLECHVQLRTVTKAFTGASARFGGAPNDHTDPYTLALPGTLPVLSRAALEAALTLGLATSCRIRPRSRFARKHYFYPDLPKGYQISQYDEPIAEGGHVELLWDGAPHRVRLTRIHMEEDAGKSIHEAGASSSLVDLNRAGVPLVEVVSEPDLRSAAEAASYLRALRQLVVWLGISDGNMEEGSLRCDANVSLRPRGQERLGTRVELKNMNSFRHVEHAIEYEIARQAALLDDGGRVVQETRLWDAGRGTSHPMRSKEEAEDYRYFPEPDLPPLLVDELLVQRIKAALPELPLARRARFVSSLGLPARDADLLTAERPIADYLEGVVVAGADPKKAANWVASELLRLLNQDGQGQGRSIAQSPIAPEALAELIALIERGTISGKIAKEVFEAMYASGRPAAAIVEERGLVQLTDESAIEAAARAVVDEHPAQADKYRAGNDKLLGFFVGQLMKRTGGKANPEAANRILKRILAP